VSGNHSRDVNRRRARRASTANRWVWWFVVLGLAVAGIVAVAVASSGSNTTSELEVAPHVSVDGTALPRLADPASDPAVGSRAPILSGKTFDRRAITVSGDGAPHVIVFVAHWCPHCQAEIPRIVTLHRDGRTSGVGVTAVATGTQSNAPNYPPSAWLKRVGWPYPVLVDTAAGTAASAYGLPAYPYLVFVDAAGNVAARVTGEVAPADLATMFAALAAGKAVPVPGVAPASRG
jgi:thiol-disulfide isomerase/thioredoxin